MEKQKMKYTSERKITRVGISDYISIDKRLLDRSQLKTGFWYTVDQILEPNTGNIIIRINVEQEARK